MPQLPFIAALLIGLTGCATNAPSPVGPADSFQLHTAPDGRVYRMDTRSGKTSWLDGNSYRVIGEQGMPQLVVGKVYRGEDGKATYRYNGAGALEKWGLDRYSSPPEKAK